MTSSVCMELMNVSFNWSTWEYHLWIWPFFSSTAKYVLLIFLGLFLRWEISGHTTAVLEIPASRICSKQHTASSSFFSRYDKKWVKLLYIFCWYKTIIFKNFRLLILVRIKKLCINKFSLYYIISSSAGYVNVVYCRENMPVDWQATL